MQPTMTYPFVFRFHNIKSSTSLKKKWRCNLMCLCTVGWLKKWWFWVKNSISKCRWISSLPWLQNMFKSFSKAKIGARIRICQSKYLYIYDICNVYNIYIYKTNKWNSLPSCLSINLSCCTSGSLLQPYSFWNGLLISKWS